MNKLIVLSGVPGSGKSYFTNTLRKVKRNHVYVVSSDQLREMVCGDVQDMSQDALIWDLYYKLAKLYSCDKEGVVLLDSTNLKSCYRLDPVKKIKDLYDEIDLVTFKIDKSIAMNQNLQRDHPVPPEAVEKMYAQLEEVTEEEKEFFNKVLTINSKEDLADVVSKLLN